MTSVERGLREASGDRHPYSRTAVAGMWMFCKRLSCRHCEEAGFLICSEGASGEHTCPGFVSMSTLPYSGRRAGSFSAPLLRAFLCANSLMDSRAFGSVMSKETLGLSPYARKGKVVHFSQEAVDHLPPVTGHPHALRRHSSFRQSCAPPSTIGRAACS